MAMFFVDVIKAVTIAVAVSATPMPRAATQAIRQDLSSDLSGVWIIKDAVLLENIKGADDITLSCDNVETTIAKIGPGLYEWSVAVKRYVDGSLAEEFDVMHRMITSPEFDRDRMLLGVSTRDRHVTTTYWVTDMGRKVTFVLCDSGENGGLMKKVMVRR